MMCFMSTSVENFGGMLLCRDLDCFLYCAPQQSAWQCLASALASVMGLPSQLIGSRGPALIERESDSQSILDLFPELKSLPAPSYGFKKGLRVYYRTSAATVPNPHGQVEQGRHRASDNAPEKLSPASAGCSEKLT